MDKNTFQIAYDLFFMMQSAATDAEVIAEIYTALQQARWAGLDEGFDDGYAAGSDEPAAYADECPF